jgi:hypothetical protein
MADGTFTAGKSRTIGVEPTTLRDLLLDPEGRADLFPGRTAELRSRPTAKSIRIAIGPGVALLSLEPASNGRTKVSVAHEKLPAAADVDEWEFYWGEWLDAIDPGAS